MAKPKKEKPEVLNVSQEQVDKEMALKQPPPVCEPPKESTVGVGDIIQVTQKGHPSMARIGIIHTIEGDQLVCYSPGNKGIPLKFKVATASVSVVGKAVLRYNRPLPEDSVYSDSEKDKI